MLGVALRAESVADLVAGPREAADQHSGAGPGQLETGLQFALLHEALNQRVSVEKIGVLGRRRRPWEDGKGGEKEGGEDFLKAREQGGRKRRERRGRRKTTRRGAFCWSLMRNMRPWPEKSSLPAEVRERIFQPSRCGWFDVCYSFKDA